MVLLFLLGGIGALALYVGIDLAAGRIIGMVGPTLLGGLLGVAFAAFSVGGIASILTHRNRPGTTPLQKLFAVVVLVLLGLFGVWILVLAFAQPTGKAGF